jgi:RimJ/RimL family protein N-acetyltransferase
MRRVFSISSMEEWAAYQPAIGALLKTYRGILLDDASRTENPDADTCFLMENTAACMPWLWVLADDAGEVWAIAALTDVQPGRHAFLHGVTHPDFRKSADAGRDIEQTLLSVLKAAFGPLALLKLKAEFERDNPGAKGFCLRLGFQREALFKADVKLDGRLRDVAIYSLPAHRYQSVLLPRLLGGLSAPPSQPQHSPLFP